MKPKTPVGAKKPKKVIPLVPIYTPEFIRWAQEMGKQKSAPVPAPVQKIAPKKEISIPDLQDSTSTQIFNLTNQYRTQNKLNPLSYSPTLSAAAQKRAEELVSKKQWSHEGFLSTTNPNYYVVTENLAEGFKSNDLAFQAWIKSPTHQKNLVNSAVKEIGIGYAVRPDGKVVLVQQFGNPK